MSFARTVKGRELTFITRLLSIFGAVEERQLQELFAHLSSREYGRIMTRLHREQLVYRTPDARYIASGRYVLDKTDLMGSVRCFWAFIKIRDKVQDFCAGNAPAIITIASGSADYDLIPVAAENIPQINRQCGELPERTVRFLVTGDIRHTAGIDRRMKNDYVLVAGENGITDMYEM